MFDSSVPTIPPQAQNLPNGSTNFDNIFPNQSLPGYQIPPTPPAPAASQAPSEPQIQTIPQPATQNSYPQIQNLSSSEPQFTDQYQPAVQHQQAHEQPHQVIQQAPPPIGSNEEADKYLQMILDLIDQGQLELEHTDLKQYDPSTLQDHYRINLGQYEIEVSHSKQPDTNQDFYIMLFNNLSIVQNICTNKVILGYIHLQPNQFKKFKIAADNFLEQKKIESEKERFKTSISPIVNILKDLGATEPVSEEETAQAQDQAYGEAYNDHEEANNVSQTQPTQPLPEEQTDQAATQGYEEYDPNTDQNNQYQSAASSEPVRDTGTKSDLISQMYGPSDNTQTQPIQQA